MARRLVRIPVLPNATVSKAATFCANGGGAANAGPNTRELSIRERRIFEPSVVELNQAPAIPAEPASRNFLRSMPASVPITFLYFIDLLDAAREQWVIASFFGIGSVSRGNPQNPEPPRTRSITKAFGLRSFLRVPELAMSAAEGWPWWLTVSQIDPLPFFELTARGAGGVRYWNLWRCRILRLGWGTILSRC